MVTPLIQRVPSGRPAYTLEPNLGAFTAWTEKQYIADNPVTGQRFFILIEDRTPHRDMDRVHTWYWEIAVEDDDDPLMSGPATTPERAREQALERLNSGAVAAALAAYKRRALASTEW